MHLAYLHYLQDNDTALHHVRQFTRAARELGHRVDVHAIRAASPSPPASRAQRDSSRGRGRSPLGRYFREPKELASSFFHHAREMRSLANCRPDVLLVRNHSLTASFLWTAARTGLPLTVEVNAPRLEALLYDQVHLHVPLLPDWLQARKLTRADSVVTVSSALRDHLISRYRLDHQRFVVSPNGADIDLFRPGIPPDAEVRSRFGDAPVVGFVGSFSKWHGVDLLVEMTREVAERRPQARFVYVGDGPDLEALRVATAHLEPRAQFLGRVPHDRVPALVAAFDIAAMPESNFYGSPLKVLEWMAAGRAVVAPAYGPLREIIDSEREGLLFEPRNREELVGAILRLVDDSGLRQRLGAAAARRVRDHLTWKDNAERVLNACQMSLSRRSP
jgi:glycosyltransferase involved in cell wall biosynthesis